MSDKPVTSKFFDEKQNAADGEKMEVDKPVEQMEEVRIDDDGDEEKNKSENDTMETNDENIKPANASDILLQVGNILFGANNAPILIKNNVHRTLNKVSYLLGIVVTNDNIIT